MNNQQLEIPVLSTLCRDCVFATYKHLQSRSDKSLYDIQDGCLLDRLDKFDNTSLKEEENLSYYEIDGRLCNTFRGQKWADQYSGESNEQLKQRVWKECQFCYDYIINLSDGDRDLELLKRSVFLSLDAEIKPKNIVIVKNANSALSNIDLFRPFKNIKEVSIEVVFEGDKMNRAVNRCPSTYFIWQDGLFPLITNEFITKINDYVNIQLQRFILIEDEDEFFTICHKQIFDNVGSNGKKRAFDKIKELAKEQNTEYLIKTFKEIN